LFAAVTGARKPMVAAALSRPWEKAFFVCKNVANKRDDNGFELWRWCDDAVCRDEQQIVL